LKAWKGNRDWTVETGDWYCTRGRRRRKRVQGVCPSRRKKFGRLKRRELTKNNCTWKEQTTGLNLRNCLPDI